MKVHRSLRLEVLPVKGRRERKSADMDFRVRRNANDL